MICFPFLLSILSTANRFSSLFRWLISTIWDTSVNGEYDTTLLVMVVCSWTEVLQAGDAKLRVSPNYALYQCIYTCCEIVFGLGWIVWDNLNINPTIKLWCIFRPTVRKKIPLPRSKKVCNSHYPIMRIKVLQKKILKSCQGIQ